MRVPRVYIDQELVPDQLLVLNSAVSHYLLNVLRLKQGDSVSLFNNSFGEFTCHLVEASKREVSVRVGELARPPQDLRLNIHLGLALLRGDRMDYAVQKATELGVASIRPLHTDFGEARMPKGDRARKKLEHLRKVAIHASEQCRRLSVPEILQPADLSAWLRQEREGLRLLMHPGGAARLAQQSAPHTITIATGAEGGFSEREVALAKEQDFLIGGLGPRVLRAETAPITAVSLLQYFYGDLSND